jgi:hypothetical protein
VTITGGRAGHGGGLRNDHGRPRLTRVLVRGNSAGAFGAGLYNSGTATRTDVIVRGDRAHAAGGLANFGELALNRVLLHGNFAQVASDLFKSSTARLIRR